MSDQQQNDIPLSFFAKLEARVAEINSHLCVGLDPHPSELCPPNKEWLSVTEGEKCQLAFEFCKNIIDATAPYAAAYKPNAAFFESLGPNLGLTTLAKVTSYIHPKSIPILLDVKRGDIGSTALAYAIAAYDHLGADGVTLSPLMGYDSLEPFITGSFSHGGAFILCKTSNPGSNDLLTLQLSSSTTTDTTLYEKIASLASVWSDRASSSSANGSKLGLVVGATDATALSKARAAAGPDIWILAPGVGAQGGDLDAAVVAGMNSLGTKMLIPVSRGISKALDKSKAAKDYRDNIEEAIRRKLVVTHKTEDDNSGILPYQQEFIEFSTNEGVLKFGSFTLKSGRTSPYFFNAGLFATGESLFKLGKAYASSIMASKELLKEDGSPKFDIVFGPAYKGISLGAVVCAALYSAFGVNVGFAYNRKEAKDHGEGGMLVGADMKGKDILIVDDVITAGTAIRESFDMLTQIGAKPIGVSIALDRAEKRSLGDPVSAVQAVARDLNIPVTSIVSLPQLQSYLKKNDDIYAADVLESVSQYRSKYGV
eukprot:CAMPEP_0197828286 /NCGR_PEP_ID=MMETSP1437-20131217/4885_1 /TAXON_ID=49252 ORGANISM="Eucampia antarctica, Strain CCMP1452" /NCGR_SAMPLE_ID=MMETSP1437 /ASSEMBLY_ACC=CAM_ASM_001096 /LENGTH=539 /DNA_ID=CAMNT_0043429455 /DNA_START=214 /DNA_END=1833 /DNA_ORIENTATION=-